MEQNSIWMTLVTHSETVALNAVDRHVRADQMDCGALPSYPARKENSLPTATSLEFEAQELLDRKNLQMPSFLTWRARSLHQSNPNPLEAHQDILDERVPSYLALSQGDEAADGRQHPTRAQML